MPVQSGVLLCLKMHCCRHVQKLSSRMIFCLKFFHVTHRIRLSNSSHCCSLEVITELQRAIKDQIHPSHAARCTGKQKRSEEQTSELKSLIRTSHAVFCL